MMRVSRFWRCPKTGKKPVTCEGCKHVVWRGPETGEAERYPERTAFCTKEEK